MITPRKPNLERSLRDLLRATPREPFPNPGGPGGPAGAPACRVHHAAGSQVIANATETALAFDSERFDTDGIHSSGSNTRLTCVTPGVYVITLCVRWDTDIVGERVASIYLNGIGVGVSIATDRRNASPSATVPVSTIYKLAAGDYVEGVVWQTSGANRNVVVLGNISPEFGMVYQGPG